ncbi:hypothetical protein ACFYUY_28455 [Kitasatospora sp. NPDC004745]|uniref:hypothetical protein n=1 Tax=unclassified Kitasatospora TaxID=2633591 RepID=UPI0033E0148B
MESISKTGLAVGTALLLAACAACSGGGGGGGAAAGPSTATVTAVPVQAETPTPLPTPTRPPYGPVLAKGIDPLAKALGQVSTAKTLGEFDTLLGTIGSAATTAGSDLRWASEPPEAATARAELVASLTKLSSDAAGVRKDIKNKGVCALGSAQAELGASEGLAGVGSALAKMAALGFQTTFAAPQTPKQQSRSLDNGTLVREGRLRGEGVFKVDNGGKSDAVVSLALNGKSVHSVYVAKGAKASIEGVEDGTYEVFFSGGVDWDSDAKAFTQSCRFTKFQDTLAFETGRTATSWSITLQPTAGGNAKTDSVDADSFPQP